LEAASQGKGVHGSIVSVGTEEYDKQGPMPLEEKLMVTLKPLEETVADPQLQLIGPDGTSPASPTEANIKPMRHRAIRAFIVVAQLKSP